MRIGVVGARDFPNEEYVRDKLKEFVRPNDTIISGGAFGVDSMAEKYAKDNQLEFICYSPLDEEDCYGKRNQRIVDASDILMAFPSAKCLGTWDTVNKAKKKGIRVVIFDWFLR